MSDPGAALEHFADYCEAMLQDISPARRKAVAQKIGQRLRRSNAERSQANVEPDGSPMTPRKKRHREQRHKAGRGRRMFREISKARNLRVRASAEGVELSYGNPRVGRVAAEHHFGLEGFVGKTSRGREIRARYPARRQIGFSPGDIDAIADELLAWLDRD